MPAAARIYRIGRQWVVMPRRRGRGLSGVLDDAGAWLEEEGEKLVQKGKEAGAKMANKAVDAALSEADKALFGEAPETGGAIGASKMTPAEANDALIELGAPTGIYPPKGAVAPQYESWQKMWSVPQIIAAYKVVGELMPAPLLGKVYREGGKPALELAVARAEWGTCDGKALNPETGQYVERTPKPKGWAIWVCPGAERSAGVEGPAAETALKARGYWASPFHVGELAGVYTPGKVDPTVYAQGLRAWVTARLSEIKAALDAGDVKLAAQISERVKGSLTGALVTQEAWFPQAERLSLLSLLEGLRETVVAKAAEAAGGTVVPSNADTDDIIKEMVSSGTAELPQVQAAKTKLTTPVKVALGVGIAGAIWWALRTFAR